MNAPEELPLPLEPPPGRSPEDALRAAVITGGFALVGVFILAALGAHFGVYHLATSPHSTGPNGTGTPYVGLDATQRAVIQPVLGFLQVLAAVLAVATLVLVILRWRRASTGTGDRARVDARGLAARGRADPGHPGGRVPGNQRRPQRAERADQHDQ